MTKKKISLVLLAAVFAAALMFASAPVQAADKYWVGGDGSWDDGNNWSLTSGGLGGAGQPQNTENVYLNQSSTSNKTVTYYNTVPSYTSLNSLTIDATGSGTMTLMQQDYGIYSTLASKNEYLGYSAWSNAKGFHTQTGGTNQIVNSLYLGYGNASGGTYNLSGTGSLSAATEYIGYSGIGVFNQTGGTNQIGNSLYIGYGNTSSFSYNTYNLSGTGSLSATTEYIGNRGEGRFYQTGGTNTVGALYVSSDMTGNGYYSLSGTGSLSAQIVVLGYNNNSAGIFSQSGGTHTVSHDLIIGGLFANGYYEYYINGGTLDVQGSITSNPASNSNFTISGGTLTNNWQSIAVGRFNIGSGAGRNGSFTMDSKNVYSINQYIGDNHGIGTFAQSGGTNQIGNSLYLGYGNADSSGSYNLSGTGSLSAATEYIGYSGIGLFNQTGGTNTVGGGAGTLYIAKSLGATGFYHLQSGALNVGTINLNAGGNFNQTGGDLIYDTFNQTGGTVQGTLQNKGTFNYISGAFEGRILNYGTANLFEAGNNFTAGDGMVHYSDLTISTGRTITLNGAGLDNQGFIMLAGGTLNGSGPLINNFAMQGRGTIGGSGGFINNGILSLSGGNIELSNTGPNENTGMINLNGRDIILQGSTLANTGIINVSSAITGTGSLTNSYGGMVKGRGNIDTMLTNSGTLMATGGTITLNGGVSNTSSGRIEAGTGNTVKVMNGLASNYGTIALAGGAYENNGHTLTNYGTITGAGTINSSAANAPIINKGMITLYGPGVETRVYGAVNNENLIGIGVKDVANAPVTFYQTMTNTGAIKVTNASVSFSGGLINHGNYISDPSTNKFSELTVYETGVLQGGIGDQFLMETKFLNYSQRPTDWKTGEAFLGFIGDESHQFSLAGADLGASIGGYSNNFAWGTLNVEGSLYLSDGNADNTGTAQYVYGIHGLDIAGNYITNIFGIDGVNIYYLASLSENAYLRGLNYDLQDGGQLRAVTATPEPATMLLLGLGLIGLAGVRRKFKK